MKTRYNLKHQTMNIKLILSLIVTLVTLNSWGQAPGFAWAKRTGAAGLDRGYCSKTDGVGNVYTTGIFSGTVDFDPGAGVYNLVSAGVEDIFIQKLDAAGNLVWAKRIGGTGSDWGFTLTLDNSNNIYVGGQFNGTVDFDPGPGTQNLVSNGGADLFILKIDASGNYFWANSIGGLGIDNTEGITLDGLNNVYVTGYFSATADFDPGAGISNLTSVGGRDIFVLKLDNSGNFQWAKSFGSTSDDYGYGIAVDAINNVYTTGYFWNTVDFDPGPGISNLTSVGSTDIYISGLDPSGNFLMVKQFGGTNAEYGFAITIDAWNNIITTGRFQQTVDFDPGPGVYNLTSATGGLTDVFICKLNSVGNFIWAKQMGGTSVDEARSIITDATGNIYTTGYFQGVADYDPGPGTFNLTSTGGLWSLFISIVDSSGNFIWASQVGDGTSGNVFGNSIYLDYLNNIIVAGNFEGTSDFDPGVGTFNMTCTGTSDIFTLKLGACNIPLIPSSITGNTTVCSGTSQTYSVTNDPSATSYTWTLPGGWTGTSTTNSINATASSTSGNITVTANNACGSSSPQTLAVTVNTTPATPGSISGTTTICSGTTNTYSVTAVPGATSYTWSLPSGWTGTSTTNSINATAGSSGTISVTATNSCGTSSASTISVTVNSTPATPGSISGSTTLCSGSSNTYSIASVAGATSYTWTLPGGWTGTSTTNSINATAGSSSGQVTVTASNTCGTSAAATLNITVNSAPATPSSITGTTTLCEGDMQTYSVTNDPTATSYTWTLPSGWSGSSATNSIGATASSTSGQVTVTATNSCGTSSASTQNITVNPLPSVSLALNATSVCVDNAVFALSGGSPAGGSFSGTGVSSGNFNAATAGVGTYTITYSYTDGNSCSNTSTDQITVNNCTSISNIESQISNLEVYPNPTSGLITLQASTPFSPASAHVVVFDLLGNIVSQWPLTQLPVTLDLSSIPPGIYLLQVKNKHFTEMTKVLKE